MKEKKLKVEVLTHTDKGIELIYAAFRQCYSKSNAGKIMRQIANGEITLDKANIFINEILGSGHESPIEHVSISYSIEGVSRALTHQLVRHRIASYSQQSQRYVDGSNFEYIIPPEIEKNTQAKEQFISIMTNISQGYSDLRNILMHECGRNEKQANEDARFVLPQAATSKIVVTMNLRTLRHFFRERCCMRAQWEIRHMANKMLIQAKEIYPVIFKSAGAKCEALGYCPEGEKFCCGRYPTIKK